MLQRLLQNLVFISIHDTLKLHSRHKPRSFVFPCRLESLHTPALLTEFSQIAWKVLPPERLSVRHILGVIQHMEQFPDIARP